jgi:hypothetical protein
MLIISVFTLRKKKRKIKWGTKLTEENNNKIWNVKKNEKLEKINEIKTQFRTNINKID